MPGEEQQLEQVPLKTACYFQRGQMQRNGTFLSRP